MILIMTMIIIIIVIIVIHFLNAHLHIDGVSKWWIVLGCRAAEAELSECQAQMRAGEMAMSLLWMRWPMLTGYWCSCILKGVLHLAFTSSVLQGVLPCLVSCERFAPCFSWGVCCGAGVFGEPTPGTPSTLQHDPSVKKDLIFIKGSFNASVKGEGCWPKGVLVKWWNMEAPVNVSDNANSFC